MTLRKYAAGFLEECEANGLPFLTTAASGNPPIIAFKAFGSFSPSMAYLEHVTITPTLGAGPRLKCNVITGSGPLFTRQNFEIATSTTGGSYSSTARFYITEESVGGYTHGLLADTEKGVYITYVILEDVGFDSYPISTYSLAPFCLEPELGAVAVDVNNNLLPTKPIWITEGYNYSLDYAAEDPVNVSFAVSPGAGAGLVPCDNAIEPDDVLRRINGQEANDKGEYGFQAKSADCITVDSRYLPTSGDPQIAVNAHCAPCCRCQDYKDTSEYIKGVALLYYKMVKKLKELITEYNSVSQQFKNRAACCSTSGSFTPRFRTWPQQNFKLQIQAMAENNTGDTIRALEMKLKHAVTANSDMSATDENGNEYTISQGQPLAVIPISEASYLYYKNLNPTSRGLQFRVESQGVVETTVDLTQFASGGSSPCQLDSFTDIPSCTGYLMMTSGIVIVDPIFRKIVNLNGTPGYIKIALTFSYLGSSPGSPCGPAQNRTIAQNIVKTVAMSPNRKSVNPCPPATGSYITAGSDGSLAIKFSDAVYGQGSLTLIYRTFADNAWTTVSEAPVSLNLTGQFEASLGTIPAQYTGAVQVVVKYTPPAAGEPGAFVTKCKAVDAADEEVDIPAEAFETATTLLL